MLGSKTFLSSDEQDYDVGDPDYEAKHPSESHAYIDFAGNRTHGHAQKHHRYSLRASTSATPTVDCA